MMFWFGSFIRHISKVNDAIEENWAIDIGSIYDDRE